MSVASFALIPSMTSPSTFLRAGNPPSRGNWAIPDERLTVSLVQSAVFQVLALRFEGASQSSLLLSAPEMELTEFSGLPAGSLTVVDCLFCNWTMARFLLSPLLFEHCHACAYELHRVLAYCML